MTPASHLSAVEIAGFIDSTLAPDARAAAELHFSNCAVCRGELASCLRLAGTVPARPSHRVSLPFVAAAAVVLAAALLPFARRVTPPSLVERGSATARAETMTPANGSVIRGNDIRLAWQRYATAVSYHVVLTDSSGTLVWSADVSDTSVTPPVALPLVSGARYFWRVDVLHGDGSSAQSRTAAFTIAP
jgi:hypothetical protein